MLPLLLIQHLIGREARETRQFPLGREGQPVQGLEGVPALADLLVDVVEVELGLGVPVDVGRRFRTLRNARHRDFSAFVSENLDQLACSTNQSQLVCTFFHRVRGWNHGEGVRSQIHVDLDRAEHRPIHRRAVDFAGEFPSLVVPKY